MKNLKDYITIDEGFFHSLLGTGTDILYIVGQI